MEVIKRGELDFFGRKEIVCEIKFKKLIEKNKFYMNNKVQKNVFSYLSIVFRDWVLPNISKQNFKKSSTFKNLLDILQYASSTVLRGCLNFLFQN